MQWLTKRVLPLASLHGAEGALSLAYRYWSGLRRDGLLPSRAAVDTPSFRLLLPDADWLRPLSRGAGRAECDFGRLGTIAAASQRSVRDPRLLGEALIEDLRTTAFTGSPVLQEITIDYHDHVDRWQHLLLPVADNGVRVTEILQLVGLRAAAAKQRRLSA